MSNLKWVALYLGLLFCFSIQSTGAAFAQYNRSPLIDSITHNDNLGAGDTLNVVLIGIPGGSATFDVLGIRSAIPMTETSPGRYEGSLYVGNDIQWSQGSVVGHLMVNGEQASKSASSVVTFTGGVNLAPRFETSYSPNRRMDGLGLNPAAGSYVTVSRPTIGATFATIMDARIVRLMVDGNDVTGMSQMDSNSITFTPGYDLNVGQHNVVVMMGDPMGYTRRQSWSFTVPQGIGSGSAYPWRNQYTYNPWRNSSVYNNSGLFVRVTNPSYNSRLNGDFNVTGVTLPFATVTVRAILRSSMIPGTMDFSSQTLTFTTQANSLGNFSVPMGVATLPRHSSMTLRVTAQDEAGNATQAPEFEIATGE